MVHQGLDAAVVPRRWCSGNLYDLEVHRRPGIPDLGRILTASKLRALRATTYRSSRSGQAAGLFYLAAAKGCLVCLDLRVAGRFRGK